jgi:hypothetical protein
MGIKLVKKVFLLTGLLAAAAVARADVNFVNGSFEQGDLEGWTITGQTPGNASTVGVAGQTSFSGSGQPIAQIVSPGLDPRTGNVVNQVFGGNHSVKVGDENPWFGGNYQNNSISQQTTVTGPAPGSLFFAWAAVQEISGHNLTDTPFFRVHVTNLTQGTDIYDVQHFEDGSSFWINAGTGFNYSAGNTPSAPGWTVEQLDLAALGVNVGDVLQLEAIARDCNPTAHAMYVYLDGFGAAPPPPGPPPTNNVPDGGASALLLSLGGMAMILVRRKLS